MEGGADDGTFNISQVTRVLGSRPVLKIRPQDMSSPVRGLRQRKDLSRLNGVRSSQFI